MFPPLNIGLTLYVFCYGLGTTIFLLRRKWRIKFMQKSQKRPNGKPKTKNLFVQARDSY